MNNKVTGMRMFLPLFAVRELVQESLGFSHFELVIEERSMDL